MLPRDAGKDLSDVSASPSKTDNVAGLFKVKDQLLTACSSHPLQTEQTKPMSQLRERSNVTQQLPQITFLLERGSWTLGWVTTQL